MPGLSPDHRRWSLDEPMQKRLTGFSSLDLARVSSTIKKLNKVKLFFFKVLFTNLRDRA